MWLSRKACDAEAFLAKLAPFPLTPTLSLGEREKHSALFRECRRAGYIYPKVCHFCGNFSRSSGATAKVGHDVPIAPFQLFERWKIPRRDRDSAPYLLRLIRTCERLSCVKILRYEIGERDGRAFFVAKEVRTSREWITTLLNSDWSINPFRCR